MRKKYKVTDLKMRSIIVNCRSKLSVQYKKGKWVKAPVGGLLVFRSKSAAKEFFWNGNFRIWECEVKGRVEPPLKGSLYKLSFRFMGYLKTLWALPANRNSRSWPYGTEAYEQVKLTKEV